MSVVVAIKQEDRVLVGADSQVTRGGTRRTMSNPNNYKIWKVKGVDNCLMAHVGTVRDANVIRVINDLIPEICIYRDEVDYKFVVQYLVPRLFEELDAIGGVIKEDNRERLESSFIFAYKDKLYLITQNGAVIEIEDYCAIGSGSSEAVGSLVSTDEYDDEERIKQAIRASATNDIYVDYPIVLANTMTNDVKIFTEKDFDKSRDM